MRILLFIMLLFVAGCSKSDTYHTTIILEFANSTAEDIVVKSEQDNFNFIVRAKGAYTTQLQYSGSYKTSLEDITLTLPSKAEIVHGEVSSVVDMGELFLSQDNYIGFTIVEDRKESVYQFSYMF